MNVLLVPAHPGFPGQIPQSRKTVVVVVVAGLQVRSAVRILPVAVNLPALVWLIRWATAETNQMTQLSVFSGLYFGNICMFKCVHVHF